MAVMLRKQRDGKPRANWYAEYTDERGKRKVINTGVKWIGTPPASGSLRDSGDDDFEQSREDAEAVLQSHKDEANRKGNATHLVEKVIEAKTGAKLVYTRIDELPEKWRNVPREAPAGDEHLKQCYAVFNSFAEFMQARNANAVYLYHIQPEDAAAWLVDIQGRYARKTSRDYYALLRGAFARFLPVGYNNPFPKITAQKGKAKNSTIHRKPFTPEELQKILETAQADSFLFPLVTCAVCTGLRRGDVCRLRWDSVDLKNNSLTVKTSKTGETVSIPIFEPLRVVLESVKKTRSPYVFPEAQKMHAENPTGLTYRFKRLIVRAFTEGQKAIPAAPVVMTEADEKAIREAETDETRCELVLQCYRLNLNGLGYKRIARETDIPLGTVGEYVRRAVAVTGKRATRTQTGISREAIDKLTRQQRETGQNAASIRDWHALRTTWVTLALMAGIEMEVVRSVTGHATVDVVLRHYFKPQQAQYHAALNGAMPSIITGKESQLSPADKVKNIDKMIRLLKKIKKGDATQKDRTLFQELAAKVA